MIAADGQRRVGAHRRLHGAFDQLIRPATQDRANDCRRRCQAFGEIDDIV